MKGKLWKYNVLSVIIMYMLEKIVCLLLIFLFLFCFCVSLGLNCRLACFLLLPLLLLFLICFFPVCIHLRIFMFDLCWLRWIGLTIFHTSKLCVHLQFVDESLVKINLRFHIYASCSGCDRTKKSSFLSF